MGPPSYMRSVVGWNVVMRLVTVLLKLLILLKCIANNSIDKCGRLVSSEHNFFHFFLLISGDFLSQTAVIWKGTERNLDAGTVGPEVHQQNSQSYRNLKQRDSNNHPCVSEERWMSGSEMKRKNCAHTHVDSRSVIAEHLQLKKWKARKLK